MTGSRSLVLRPTFSAEILSRETRRFVCSDGAESPSATRLPCSAWTAATLRLLEALESQVATSSRGFGEIDRNDRAGLDHGRTPVAFPGFAVEALTRRALDLRLLFFFAIACSFWPEVKAETVGVIVELCADDVPHPITMRLCLIERRAERI